MPEHLNPTIEFWHTREHSFNVEGMGIAPDARVQRVVDTLEFEAYRINDPQTRRLMLIAATGLIEKAFDNHLVPSPPKLDD